MTNVIITEQRNNGITFFQMKNDYLDIRLSNLGGHILSIFAKDRNGKIEDVVLGYENVEDCRLDGTYMGAIVGRVANRIGNASFTLNNVEYQLKANNGPNHLHGGEEGFNQKIFDYAFVENGVRLYYYSPHMEEGYPGNLELNVTYKLIKNVLSIHYDAICDHDTLVNFTNHSYFNLSGGKEKIYHHKLRIASDTIACVDENCLANGTFRSVENTPFDFRDFHELGERIYDKDEQLELAGGYDHAFLLNQEENEQIVLYDEISGRKLSIFTDMPTVQVYTGNYLSGSQNGKNGRPYENRDGVALETQFLPNAIHIEDNPKVILRMNQRFESETRYQFEVI